MFTRKESRRRSVSTVVASIFFIMMLAIAVAFIEIVLLTSSVVLREQANVIEERVLSAELTRSISGWWKITSDGLLEINITISSTYPISLTGLAIVYIGGEYDVMGPNIDTVGERLVEALIKKPGGTNTTLQQPVFPIILGYSESMILKIIPKNKTVIAISLSVTKPGSPAIVSTPLPSYREFVVKPPIEYSVVLAPTILGNGTVATLGYNFVAENYTPTDIILYNGSSTDTIDKLYYNDDNYFNIYSRETGYTGSWLNGWSYRIELEITENTGTTLEEYQLRIVISSSTMPVDMLNHLFTNTQPSGEDIRFTLEDGTLIPYWIQKWDPVNKEAIIWVKIPVLTGGAITKIYMYYGNPSASSESNLLNVMETLPASDGVNYVIYYEPWIMDESLITTPPYYFRTYFGDDRAFAYSLPFTFPYYSDTYTRIYIVSNGHIDLGDYWTDYTSTINEFKSRTIISPFWADLMDGDFIWATYAILYDPYYSDEYGSGVYFLWRSQFYSYSGLQVFGVVLYSNGLIRFDYGTITGSSSTDDTPVIGVSYGDDTHYTLLVESDYEDASNWSEHPSILLWPRKKALVEPTYTFTGVQRRAEYVIDTAIVHGVPENTTYGTIYAELTANTTITIQYYLWDGANWIYVGDTVIDQPGRDYVIVIDFNTNHIVDSNVTYLLKTRSLEPVTLSIDFSLAEAHYPLTEPAIYVGVGGSNTILIYGLDTQAFSDTVIETPTGVVFDGTTTIVCDDEGTLWLASGTSLYYYDEESMTWIYYATIPEELGHGTALIYYRGVLYVIVGGGSSSMYLYNIATGETTPTRIDLGYPVGGYAVATLAEDSIYIAIGGDSTIFIKYNISSKTIVELENTPTARLVGLAYDRDRGYIWSISEGGGIYYYMVSENKWKPLDSQPPYSPQGESNRLIYYNNKLYHFRNSNTRELWIITLP